MNVKRKTMRKGALVATLALATGLALAACSQAADTPPAASYEGVTTVARAEFPAKPAAEDYEAQDQLLSANQLDGAFLDELAAFSYRSAATVLADKPQENGNFSPASQIGRAHV